MPFDHIQVNISDLQIVSTEFNATAAELEQLLQRAQNQIESLQAAWQGRAASDYIALITKWNADVQEIHEMLDTINQHLKQAVTAYQETDTGIARGFQIN